MGGTYMRRPYAWSNTSVKEKVGLSVGALRGGEGAYRWRNTVFHDILGILNLTKIEQLL